jgi:hypothetical protein
MPLYTYILVYKGQSYVAQGRHSNFRGFVSSWTSELPSNALPGLTPNLQKELGEKAYRGAFDEVSNRKHVWTKAIEVGDSEFRVYAVQTQP